MLNERFQSADDSFKGNQTDRIGSARSPGCKRSFRVTVITIRGYGRKIGLVDL